MRRLFFITLIFPLILPFAVAHAERPPPPAPKADLESITGDLAAEQKSSVALKKRLSGMEKDLDHTKSALVALADDIRKNEQNLGMLDKKIIALKEEEQSLIQRMENAYGSMAEIVLALTRLRRTPPELLAFKPEAPLRTAQSALILRETAPVINDQTAALAKDIARLHDITDSLEKDRRESLALKNELEQKRASLDKLAEKRAHLYRSTQKDYEQNARRISRLSEEAKTLKDLLERLDTETARQASVKTVSVLDTKIPASGRARMPAEGTVIERFGALNAIGAKNQGIMLETVPGTLVVAPMGGIVRFTGPFKNYGNMIIIEHKDGYHSLIAGLSKIAVGANAHVKPGEPVGELPQASSRGGKPALYYELRYKGAPADPALVFPEIKS